MFNIVDSQKYNIKCVLFYWIQFYFYKTEVMLNKRLSTRKANKFKKSGKNMFWSLIFKLKWEKIFFEAK